VHTEALILLGESLGISRNDLARAERPATVYVERVVTGEHLGNVSEAKVKAVLDSFEQAIHIEIGLPEMPPDLEITFNSPIEMISERIHHFSTGGKTDAFRVTISVDKNRLAKTFSESLAFTGKILCFLFSENLINFLTESGLVRLCQELFPQPYSPCLIIVGDNSLSIQGGFIHIVGGAEIHNIASVSLNESKTASAKAISNLAHTTVRWMGFQLPVITPFHFLLPYTSKAASETPIKEALHYHFVTLFLLHTANVAMLLNDRFEFAYASSGGEQVTKLTLTRGFTVNETIYKSLDTILEWLSSQGSEEKLRYLQTVVAQKLSDHISITDFLQQIDIAFIDAKQFYLAGIDGKIAKNFDTIQSVSRYVAQTNTEIGNAVDNLTKGLNDAVVAAIGVVIGGLITALTGGRTTNVVFSALMFSYVFYIVAFQIIFRMSLMWNSFQILSDSAKLQLSEYVPKLGQDRITTLTKSLERRKNQFRFSFWATFAIFWFLAVAFVLLATHGPTLFTSAGALQAFTSRLENVELPTEEATSAIVPIPQLLITETPTHTIRTTAPVITVTETITSTP
jgi:hypothetical protein